MISYSYSELPLQRGIQQAPYDVAVVLRNVKAELLRCWGDISVQGELRSFKAYPSGHIYFDLRDRKEDALLSCVLFRRDAQRLAFSPKIGDLVEIRGNLNVYEPRGQLNFIARTMKPAGAGDLFAQFLALKEKLAAQGLFDQERKKEIPLYPCVIGIVTSPEAAALRDALRTLALKAPWVKVILYPTSVQGEAAEGEILEALQQACERREADVLLIVRGGGSIADLWCFNSEKIALRLADMPMPVISGIGHEVDFTIADFVSDVRAATPTAAAALVVDGWVHAALRIRELYDRQRVLMQRMLEVSRMRLSRGDRLRFAFRALLSQARARLGNVGNFRRLAYAYLDRLAQQLDNLQEANSRAMHQHLEVLQNRVQISQARLLARKPNAAAQKMRLAHAQTMLSRAALHQLYMKKERLDSLNARLQTLDVASVLRRGYSLALSADGKPVADARALTAGQEVRLVFSKGSASAEIKQIKL